MTTAAANAHTDKLFAQDAYFRAKKSRDTYRDALKRTGLKSEEVDFLNRAAAGAQKIMNQVRSAAFDRF